MTPWNWRTTAVVSCADVILREAQRKLKRRGKNPAPKQTTMKNT